MCRSIEKSGVPWGPTPPPHVGAMLKGRLALRALGGREGEILATKVDFAMHGQIAACKQMCKHKSQAKEEGHHRDSLQLCCVSSIIVNATEKRASIDQGDKLWQLCIRHLDYLFTLSQGGQSESGKWYESFSKFGLTAFSRLHF